MKKTLLATTLATITLISASSAFAADTVDLSVGGTIAPIACVPTLSGGGTIDYGDIKADTLKTDDYTVLPKKTINFSMTCGGATKVALKAVNGRIGTAAGTITTDGANGALVAIPGFDRVGVAGLGLAGTSKIGGYSLRVGTYAVDGNIFNNQRLYREGDIGSPGQWTLVMVYWDRMFGASNIALHTATIDDINPASFKTLATELTVQAYINKASELDITQPIKLDGSATIELVYL